MKKDYIKREKEKLTLWKSLSSYKNNTRETKICSATLVFKNPTDNFVNYELMRLFKYLMRIHYYSWKVILISVLNGWNYTELSLMFPLYSQRIHSLYSRYCLVVETLLTSIEDIKWPLHFYIIITLHFQVGIFFKSLIVFQVLITLQFQAANFFNH